MVKRVKNIENIKEICVYNIDDAQYYLIKDEDGNIKTNKGFLPKLERTYMVLWDQPEDLYFSIIKKHTIFLRWIMNFRIVT